MRRPLSIAVPVLVFLLLVCVVWRALPPDQPYYKGKSLFAWIEQHAKASNAGDPRTRDEAEIAIRHIGTNALPTLLAWISKTDSPFKKQVLIHWPFGERARLLIHLEPGHVYHSRTTYACGVLKSIAKPIAPQLAGLLKDPDAHVRSSAAFALLRIGPSAADAVPALLETMWDAEAGNNAFAALRSIGVESDIVIPALMSRLSSTNMWQQALAMHRLAQYYGSGASAAVPRILQFLDNNEWTLREGATNALKTIDPIAASKAGIETNSPGL
jgi:hypothetical protein